MRTRLVTSEAADVVLAAGSDSSLTPTLIAGSITMRALTSAGISRPFDVGRDGSAASEAPCFVLEPLRESAYD
ncbi:beta-ketoacyl synthase N-terminal-like domain-containing protein [Amycolatopsis sp. NPDC049253]|uniref:beta-ketoacyl synthase N-terminal-like domain-containing protein n=1 Tax=Amycolatopsis sp. NPDC049253 TaxID=3155274 RepID=UPI003432DD13